jgi:hypothetical protein
MGYFPYECMECGGAYERCARGCEPGEGCDGDGSQFCWEDEVICIPVTLQVQKKTYSSTIITQIFEKIKDKPLSGTYNGTGDFQLKITKETLDNDETLFKEFQEMEDNKWPSSIFVDEDGANDLYNCIIVNVWCKSCYSEEEDE